MITAMGLPENKDKYKRISEMFINACVNEHLRVNEALFVLATLTTSLITSEEKISNAERQKEN